MRYWKASKEMSSKLIAVFEEYKKFLSACRKLKRKVNAEKIYHDRGFGTIRVSALQFLTPPGDLWKQVFTAANVKRKELLHNGVPERLRNTALVVDLL